MKPSRERGWQAALALACLWGATLFPSRADGADDERVEMASIDIESLLDLRVEAVTRRAERASEAPANVFVVTAEDIRRQGFRTLSEVLSSVPGLFSYPGNVEQVGVRGMGVLGDFTTRLLLLIDGHPISNALGTDVSRGPPVPLSAVERVEVIKGPAGSVYGPTAFFGVVNLVTKGGPPGMEAWVGGEAEKSTVRAGEVSLALRGRRGEAEGTAAADFYSSRGFDYTFPEVAGLPGSPPGGLVKGMDFGDSGNGYLRGSWRGLSASVACGHLYSGLSGILEPDHRSVYESLTCFAELGWHGVVAEGLTLTSRASFDDFDVRAGRLLPAPPVSVGLFEDKGYDRWGTLEERADWQPSSRLRIELGATLEEHRVEHQSGSSSVAALAAQLTTDFTEVNGWSSVEWKLRPDLTLHGGLNFYDHSQFGSQFTPKLAGVWQPSPGDTAKAVWSMGFRPPTFVEALFTDNFAYLKNSDLRPEKVSSTELDYEHRFAGVASLELGLFWDHYSDLIGYVTVPAPGLSGPPDPTNPADFRQIGENSPNALDVLGGELALTLRFGSALQAYGGLSLQHIDDPGRPNFPGLIANLAVSTRALWEPLLLSARGAALSARTKEPTSVAPGQPAGVPASFSLAALVALDVPGVPGLAIEAAVLNLLDAANPSPAPVQLAPVEELPEAPRTLRADLRYQF
ncbi:MAG TPA: TonB-dependent receptor [Anaeromyxobacteraceae bacterium]|nr:TonB-dependent receptor [Anaeromyxobacteraceae bacterium]